MFFSPASANDKIEGQIVSVPAQAVAEIVKEQPAKAQCTRKEMSHLKIFWDSSYNSWSETELKKKTFSTNN